MKTVLVVEDEMKIARVVRDYLTDAGFDVIVASSGEAAIASAVARAPTSSSSISASPASTASMWRASSAAPRRSRS